MSDPRVPKTEDDLQRIYKEQVLMLADRCDAYYEGKHYEASAVASIVSQPGLRPRKEITVSAWTARLEGSHHLPRLTQSKQSDNRDDAWNLANHPDTTHSVHKRESCLIQ